MKAIIHIGSGKAGSTSIQRALSRASTNGPFCFPSIIGGNNQNIDLLFKENNKFARGTKAKIARMDLTSNKVEDIFSRFESSLGPDLIISSEYLFGFSLSEISKLEAFLRGKGYLDIQVILYLREPKSYFKSAIQQKVKASAGFILPSSIFPSWVSNIKNWRKIFPNLKLKEFNRKRLLNGDVVSDFAHECSVHFDQEIKLESRLENDSLSAEALFLLSKYHKLSRTDSRPPFTADVQALIRICKKISGSYSDVLLKRTIEEEIELHSQELEDYLEEAFSFQFLSGGSIRNRPINQVEIGIDQYELCDLIVKPSEDLLLDFSANLLAELLNADQTI